jgi:hypothetical protein
MSMDQIAGNMTEGPNRFRSTRERESLNCLTEPVAARSGQGKDRRAGTARIVRQLQVDRQL